MLSATMLPPSATTHIVRYAAARVWSELPMDVLEKVEECCIISVHPLCCLNQQGPHTNNKALVLDSCSGELP